MVETPDSDVADELGKTACQWPQCNRLLTADEIRGCRRRFGDRRWCKEHGKQAVAEHAALKGSEAALEGELDERLEAEE